MIKRQNDRNFPPALRAGVKIKREIPVPYWQARWTKNVNTGSGNQDMIPMPADPHREVLRLLSDRMVREGGFGDYLLSEQFSRFCREYDIYELWSGFLTNAGDRPDLYGSDMIRNAFFPLLQHLYQWRKSEFPRILAGILADYAKKPPGPMCVPAIRQDLIRLGYTSNDVDDTFSAVNL